MIISQALEGHVQYEQAEEGRGEENKCEGRVRKGTKRDCELLRDRKGSLDI